MDCQYTSREQWSSIWTASTPVDSGVASTPVESSGVTYMDCQYTSSGEQWSSILDNSESSGVLFGLQYTSREQWSSIWTGLQYTRREYTSREQWSSIWTIPVHQQRVVEFYMESLHQQRVVEFYMDFQYTSREQWSSIWTASTPVESSGVLQ